ncbi:MAG: pseudouridine synthase, partial [Phascolarctobacterium sp.]
MEASKALSNNAAQAKAWHPLLPQVLSPAMIAYEDDFMLIIDKPAGILVHPTVSQWNGTLYDLVKAYYAERGITADIHPVSRLDRNTSGLVIFAKEPIIQFWLSQQEVVKEYLAIAQGHLTQQHSLIDAPIAR